MIQGLQQSGRLGLSRHALAVVAVLVLGFLQLNTAFHTTHHVAGDVGDHCVSCVHLDQHEDVSIDILRALIVESSPDPVPTLAANGRPRASSAAYPIRAPPLA